MVNQLICATCDQKMMQNSIVIRPNIFCLSICQNQDIFLTGPMVIREYTFFEGVGLIFCKTTNEKSYA